MSVDVASNDIVFVTTGSQAADLSAGTMDTPPGPPPNPGRSWALWKKGSVAKFHLQRRLQRLKIMKSMGYDSLIVTGNRLCDRAGPATRPQLPMAVDLPGNHRSLNARQKLLRFGQGQTQVRDIAKTFRPTDFYQIGAQAAGVILGRNQPQNPSHPRSPSRLSTGRSYLPCRHPPICGHRVIAAAG